MQELEKTPVSVIIRNISFHCTELDLFTLFRSFGIQVLKITVKRSETVGKSLLYAFAEVADEHIAALLCQQCDGMKFKGRTMRIELCNSTRSSPVDFSNGFEVHVAYTSGLLLPECQITEEVMEHLFQHFGEVCDIIVREHREEYDAFGTICSQQGFAFIYFQNPYYALHASQCGSFNAYNMDFKCELSKKTKRTLRQMGLLEQYIQPPQSGSYIAQPSQLVNPMSIAPILPPPPLLPLIHTSLPPPLLPIPFPHSHPHPYPHPIPSSHGSYQGYHFSNNVAPPSSPQPLQVITSFPYSLRSHSESPSYTSGLDSSKSSSARSPRQLQSPKRSRSQGKKSSKNNFYKNH